MYLNSKNNIIITGPWLLVTNISPGVDMVGDYVTKSLNSVPETYQIVLEPLPIPVK